MPASDARGRDWPRAQQNKLASGNQASTMGTKKIVWKGMQATREDGTALPTAPSWTGSSCPRPSSGHAAKEALTELRDVCRNLMDMTKIKKDSKYLTAINPSGRESILKKKK